MYLAVDLSLSLSSLSFAVYTYTESMHASIDVVRISESGNKLAKGLLQEINFRKGVKTQSVRVACQVCTPACPFKCERQVITVGV